MRRFFAITMCPRHFASPHGEKPRLGGLPIQVALLTMCLALFSCRSPETRARKPREVDKEAKERYTRGLVQIRRGNFPGAQESFLKAISLDQDFLEAHRQYQNLKFSSFRRGEVILEYKDWLQRNGNSPSFHYLFGRVAQDPREKIRAFSTAISLDPFFFWGNFGLAHVLERQGNIQDALGYYKLASELAPERPEPHLRSGLILWKMGMKEEAEESFLKAFPNAEKDGLFLAKIALFYDHEEKGLEALKYAILALSQSPHEKFVHGVLIDLLEKYGNREHFWNTVDVLDQIHSDGGRKGLAHGLREIQAFAYRNLGYPLRAASIYEDAYSRGNRSPGLASALRKLYVGLGRYGDAFRVWKASIPSERVFSSANLLRGRFEKLFRATRKVMEKPEGKDELLLLAHSYKRVGWLEEAEEVYGRLSLLYPRDPAVERNVQRVEQCQELIRNLQAYFRSKYSGYASGENGISLESVLSDVYEAARTITGLDFKREPGPLNHYPLIGSMTLPWGEEGGALDAYLNSFNYYLIMGKRNGAEPEALLFKGLVRERELQRKVWGKEVQFDLFISEESLIRAYQDFLGTRTTGITFEDTIFILFDALQSWQEEEKALVELLNYKQDLLFSDSFLPAAEFGGIASLGHPLFLREKLLQLSFEKGRKGEKKENGCSQFLQMVEWHEIGHMVDVQRYLPLEENILRNFWLAARNSFSPQSIEGELEGKAQLTALAFSNYPYLSLAYLVGFLPYANASPPHSQGFFAIAGAFVSYVQEHLSEYPAIQDSYPIVEQLYLLTRDEIRHIALELGKEKGF